MKGKAKLTIKELVDTTAKAKSGRAPKYYVMPIHPNSILAGWLKSEKGTMNERGQSGDTA